VVEAVFGIGRRPNINGTGTAGDTHRDVVGLLAGYAKRICKTSCIGLQDVGPYPKPDSRSSALPPVIYLFDA